MYISISKSGPKAEVVNQLRTESQSDPPAAVVEAGIRNAIADHLEAVAVEGSVSVSCSISLSYLAKLTSDGQEIPIESKPGEESAVA